MKRGWSPGRNTVALRFLNNRTMIRVRWLLLDIRYCFTGADSAVSEAVVARECIVGSSYGSDGDGEGAR
jgi:hypothetical protein